MYGHRNVVAKSMVIEDIDGKEQRDIDQPSFDRNLVFLEEEGRTAPVDLGRQADEGNEEKLDKGQECTCECWEIVSSMSSSP